MTDREELIALLDDGCYKACSDASGKKVNEVLADYLLENGVIVVDTSSVKRENLPLIQQAFSMPLDELAELVDAKQSGKIIELPCKIGDTIYRINSMFIPEYEDGVISEMREHTKVVQSTLQRSDIAIYDVYLSYEEAEKFSKFPQQARDFHKIKI